MSLFSATGATSSRSARTCATSCSTATGPAWAACCSARRPARCPAATPGSAGPRAPTRSTWTSSSPSLASCCFPGPTCPTWPPICWPRSPAACPLRPLSRPLGHRRAVQGRPASGGAGALPRAQRARGAPGAVGGLQPDRDGAAVHQPRRAGFPQRSREGTPAGQLPQQPAHGRPASRRAVLAVLRHAGRHRRDHPGQHRALPPAPASQPFLPAGIPQARRQIPT